MKLFHSMQNLITNIILFLQYRFYLQIFSKYHREQSPSERQAGNQLAILSVSQCVEIQSYQIFKLPSERQIFTKNLKI